MRPEIIRFSVQLFVLICFLQASAQSPTICNRYGGDDIEYASQLIRDANGHYVMTGRSYSFQVSPGQIWGDIYTIKLDASFNLLWTSVFQTPMEDEGNAIVNTYDGGYLIAGASYNLLSGYDIALVKLDSGGTLSWSKLLSTELNEQAEVIISSSDDAYVIAGYADSLFTGVAQSFVPFIAKIDQNGSVLWARRFGFSSGVFAGSVYDVVEAPDGSLLVTGDIIRLAQGPDDSDVFIARFSSAGNLLWFKWMGTDCQGCHEMGSCIVAEGAQVFTAIASSGPYNGLYLCTFDLNGNILHERGIPTGTFAYSGVKAVKTSGNGTLIACPGGSSIMMVKTDGANTVEWSAIYGDGAWNTPCTILKSGQRYILAGYTGPMGTFGEDYLVAELDSMGNSCCMISEMPPPAIVTLHLPDSSGGIAFPVSLAENPAGSVTTGGVERFVCSGYSNVIENNTMLPAVFPNPFHDFLGITFGDEKLHNLQVFNAAGTKIADVTARKTAGIQTRHWPAGIYAVQIDRGAAIKVVKF